MRRLLRHGVLAALVLAPAAARAQAAPAVATPPHATQPPRVEARDVDANVGSQTDRPPSGSSADRRGSLEGERLRSEAANADADGVTRAVALDAFQRELGDVARKRGSTARVRQLGARVTNGAGEADEVLHDLAGRLQLAPPPKKMTPDQSARIEELKKEPKGADLDRRIVDAMMEAQREELDLLNGMLARQADGHDRWLIDRAARSIREIDRAAAIERRSM